MAINNVSKQSARPSTPDLQRARVTSRSGTWVLAVACACGSSDDRPPPPSNEVVDYDPTGGDGRDVYAVGSCAEGDTKSCRIYLPAHNGVQPCFVGVQTCTDQTWGPCGDAVLVDANADDAALEEEPVAASDADGSESF